jgi:biotin--protein ligase
MKKILLYSDKGASLRCVKQTEAMLNSLFKGIATTDRISASSILEGTVKIAENAAYRKNESEGSVLDSADMLVFPGGEDSSYEELMKGQGNQRIREFVENGGFFLGICAGAYYGCKRIEFDMETGSRIEETRELGFFDGVAWGPLFNPYIENSHQGASAEPLQINEKFFEKADFEPVVAYYNGGCGFRPSAKSEAKILAWYKNKPEIPAIVQCQVGKGTALLSGIHFEWDPFTLNEHQPFVLPLIQPIAATNEKRLRLAKRLLDF